jgi:NAD(P)-dependent dehydrogenase (short-subunit alcohol dehydrogenase family)
MSELVDGLFSPAEFRDRVALVTGGTDGLGEHLTRTLAALECDVFFCGRRAALGEKLAAELGPRAHFVTTDLAHSDQTCAFVETAGSFRGRLDYVVCNAATDPRIAIDDITEADFDRLIAINLKAYVLTAHAALPWLRRGQGRAIVNIGTTNYLLGIVGCTLYASAKAGVYGFTRTLARELGPEGIRVNLVSPGWIATRRQLAEHMSAADLEQLLVEQCVKETITAAHVTPVTLFMLSSGARAMSGQNLVVDGGLYMH